MAPQVHDIHDTQRHTRHAVNVSLAHREVGVPQCLVAAEPLGWIPGRQLCDEVNGIRGG